jgi:hypothetical protein
MVKTSSLASRGLEPPLLRAVAHQNDPAGDRDARQAKHFLLGNAGHQERGFALELPVFPNLRSGQPHQGLFELQQRIGQAYDAAYAAEVQV